MHRLSSTALETFLCGMCVPEVYYLSIYIITNLQYCIHYGFTPFTVHNIYYIIYTVCIYR